ncbi:hypothetical protein PVL29_018606 [Vitis rotundifolia]|uniref:pyridoxal kinase n=1 Tax=Vitis rotundifolia TaxID=103349 RepID=A0AA38Z5E2_VITRO|nr:hypothetical protein PVL29_018606 [Vitis rotundifolia]
MLRSRSPLLSRLQPARISGVFFFRYRSFSKKSLMAAPPILSLALPSETGRVLSIQSHTVQGYVGNKSAVFPLQLLGYDVDPINSVQFSNHTGKLLILLHSNSLRTLKPEICQPEYLAGYPTFKGQVLNGQQLGDLIAGLEENNLLYYTHLLTVCDPVMGDEGKLYVPTELVAIYREKVVPVASMLTPNQFEAELLTGFRIVAEKDGREACNILHASGPSKGHSPEQFKIVMPKIPAYFTGTGDLMTALLLGWSNKYPDNLDKAAELAVSSLQALLKRTLADYLKIGFDPQSSSLEIRLVQSQDDIRHPEVKYKAERYT